MTTARYMGATFSLMMLVATLAGCFYFLCFTKLSLGLPVTLGSLAAINALMVVHDWPGVWKPLLARKP